MTQRYVIILWLSSTGPIGYEPAGLTVPRMIEGGFIFFVWVSSVTKIFSSKKKVDFVGDICIETHQNVVLRHNHLNPISTKLTYLIITSNISFYRFHRDEEIALII